MEVTSVSFQPSDTRFYFEPPNNERILLEPFKNNIVSKYVILIHFTEYHLTSVNFPDSVCSLQWYLHNIWKLCVKSK